MCRSLFTNVSARRSSLSALSCLLRDSATSQRPATTSPDGKGGVLPLSRHELRLLTNTMTGFDMEAARLQADGAPVYVNDETTPALHAIQSIDRALAQSRLTCLKISSPLSLPVLYNRNDVSARRSSVPALSCLETPWNGVWAGMKHNPRPAPPPPPDSAPSPIEHFPATTSPDGKALELPLSRHELRMLTNTITGFDMEVARLQADGAPVCVNHETTPALHAIQSIDRALAQSRVKSPKISSPLSLPVIYNRNEAQDIPFKTLETLHVEIRLQQAGRLRKRVQKPQSSFFYHTRQI